MSKPILKDWSILFFDDPSDSDPKIRRARLGGNVFGHPYIADGCPVVTSKLISFDSETMTAKTQNTDYILGRPSKGFEDWLGLTGRKLSDYNGSI